MITEVLSVLGFLVSYCTNRRQNIHHKFIRYWPIFKIFYWHA